MTFSSEDILSVAKLVIYVPLLFGAAFVCYRHGIRKNSCWIYLAIFCLVRIVGAAATLYTISSTSTTAYTISAVCSVLGLSPLLMATLGIVSRPFTTIMSARSSAKAAAVPIRILQLLCVVGLILCVVAATNAPTPAQVTGESDLKIGVGLFTAVYVLLVLVTIFSSLHMSSLQPGESAIIGTVAFALILLAVRLLYSILGTFGHNSSFNAITGSIGIQIGMATWEEVFVTAAYIILGAYLAQFPNNGIVNNGNQKEMSNYGNAQPRYPNAPAQVHHGRREQQV